MNLICYHCGCTTDLFLETGLFGCGDCYTVFLNSREAGLFSKSEVFEKIKIYNSNEKVINYFLDFFIKKNISIRFRVARNFKRQFYLNKLDSSIYSILDRFLENTNIKKFDDYGKIYFFDEDHIRAEFYLQNANYQINHFPNIFYDHTLFDYHTEYGYLTACPTNSGRGNKVSALIEISRIKEDYRERFFIEYKENILGTIENKIIILFLKNYNKIKLFNFLYHLYKFIKINTYI